MIDIESLLAPTNEEPPCGPDLEYDATFMDMEQAARGKPEQQFGETVIPAEEPAWGEVRNAAIELFSRTKDLRIAVLLARALVRTDNFAGFPVGIELIRRLVADYWDGVHPQLDADDGNDPIMRMNALAPLVDGEAMLRDLRSACVVDSRQHGTVTVRDVEIATGKLPAPENAEPVSQSQIESIVRAAAADDSSIVGNIEAGVAAVEALSALLADKVGSDRSPDFKPLLDAIRSLRLVCPTPAAESLAVEAGGETEGGQAAGAPISGDIRTRQDALVMIDKIVTYFERHEPTNPAPLLLLRAKRLMSMSFVDIIKDMVPDSLSQIENIAGLSRDD